MNTNVSNFEQTALGWIADMLGVTVDELSTDMHLDADLALDSIKMMALLNHLMNEMAHYGHPLKHGINTSQWISQAQTLADVIEFLRVHSDQVMDELTMTTATEPEPEPEPEPESLSILNSQYVFILGRYVAATSSLCHSVRVKGVVDAAQIQRSWQILVERYPALQVYFQIPADATRLSDFQQKRLINASVPDIRYSDLRGLTAQQQDMRCDDELEHWINHPWDITQWPLHQVSLLQLGDDTYELLLATDHAVSDGLGNQQLIRELLEVYRELSRGEPPENKIGSVVDYERLIQQINDYQNPQEAAYLNDYVKQQGRDTFCWHPEQKPSPLKDGRIKNRVYQLSLQETQQLNACVQAWRIPMNSLLVSTMIRALAHIGPACANYLIQVPTSGKLYPGIDATGVVGPFAQNMALSFAAPKPDETCQQQAVNVNTILQNALMNGLDRAQTHQFGQLLKNDLVLENGLLPNWMATMLSHGVKSNVYMPYTGNTQIQRHYGDLTIEQYRAGTYNKGGTIDLQQELFDRRLHIFFNYDSEFFDSQLIEHLATTYLNELKRCIASLTSPDRETLPYSISATEHSETILTSLRQIGGELLNRNVSIEDANRDLEAELGIDSLERVRLITRLITLYTERVDRPTLFAARTLAEMASAIHAEHSAQPPSATEQITEPAMPDTDSIPPVPFLHFVRYAKANPEQTAIRSGKQTINYQQLNERSNQLANYLIDQGIKEGDVVAILCDRGIQMVVSMLAVLKTGAAYLALEIGLPSARIRSMLTLGQADWLLTETAVANQLMSVLNEPHNVRHLVYLDDYSSLLPASMSLPTRSVNRSRWGTYPNTLPNIDYRPESIMAIMFTSGSTGTPKGIATSHQSYMNRLQWHQQQFQLRPGERVAQNTSCSFDISIREIFWPLMVGGTICPVDRELVANPWRLANWLQKEQIQVFQFVPSLFTAFIEAMAHEPSWQFPDLRWLLFSTEPLMATPVRQWIDRFGMRVGIANQYGPSECAIEATCYVVPKRPDEQDLSIPIGKAMTNVHLLILDEHKQPVADGTMGEIYIGGVQVAQGYLRNPTATAEAFVNNTFDDVPGPYLYRTGDLAVRQPDGQLIFHGRRDNQIKIRGNRVELGEVEAVLLADDRVQEAALIAVEQAGSKRLIAWLSGVKAQEADIRQRLQRTLPDYMMPHQMSWLDKLPRNYNGKIDRAVLHARYKAQTEQSGSTSITTLPLGPAQRWLVNYFRAPYQWWGLARYTFKQSLSPQAFEKSFQEIINRHDSLRTTFSKNSSGDWQQTVHPVGHALAFHPEFLDGSELTEEHYNEALQTQITEFVTNMRIDTWPLIKAWVIKRQEKEYEICIAAHHLISDMISGHATFQQLWQGYSEVLSRELPAYAAANQSLKKQESSYEQFVQVLIEKEQQGLLKNDLQYWKTQTGPVLHFLADRPEGANLERSTNVARFALSEHYSQQLLANARRAFGKNMHTILLAPWYQLLHKNTKQPRVVLSHRMHGRDTGNGSLQFSQSVGSFAINVPVGIDVQKTQSWPKLIAEISEVFTKLPSAGISYDWLSNQLPKEIYPDNKLTPLRINYLGHTNNLQSDMFEFNWEKANRRFMPPEQQRISDIEAQMFFSNKQLKLHLDYSTERYYESTIQGLGEGYLSLLEQMIESIVDNKPKSFTDV